MEITLKQITIHDLVKGYQDNGDNGVVAYGGKLDVRPPFQREFVYNDKQRAAVIHSVRQGYPLNVMYWALREDGTYEIIDGQQRTISICQYIEGDFSFDMMYFHNLQDDEQEQIKDYKLMVYICDGTESEKLKWFETINIAGAVLTKQELRNAVYAGKWLASAKRYFSKNECVAYQIGNNYLNGTPIRQDYLETALKWISNNNIEPYMASHQHDPNALQLWQYFQSVITWVENTFTNMSGGRRRLLKGQEWGEMYNQHKDRLLDPEELDKLIGQLLLDDEVQNKRGIYPFVLDGKEKHLNLRGFTDSQKIQLYEKQSGKCRGCFDEFELEAMEGDHIIPWSKGGRTILENGQMLCVPCNRSKSAQ